MLCLNVKYRDLRILYITARTIACPPLYFRAKKTKGKTGENLFSSSSSSSFSSSSSPFSCCCSFSSDSNTMKPERLTPARSTEEQREVQQGRTEEAEAKRAKLFLPSTETKMKLLVKKLSESATLPARASKGAAGYDLCSAHDIVVPAKGKAIVPTDLAIAVPPTCYGRVAPRSGLAVKHFLDVGAGVIDSDYRGNVGVVMFNFSDTDYQVSKGDRIAQLILEQIYTPDVEEVTVRHGKAQFLRSCYLEMYSIF
eukprot:m.19278 g.19278  ORF g.19278 m.19278 type:complete len:254 (-) comp8648_c0_seq1:62-823(-)